MTTQTGSVKWYDHGRGFGLIEPDGGGKELPVHFTQIQGGISITLAENQRVRFEVTQGQHGLKASNVREES